MPFFRDPAVARPVRPAAMVLREDVAPVMRECPVCGRVPASEYSELCARCLMDGFVRRDPAPDESPVTRLAREGRLGAKDFTGAKGDVL